MGYKRACLTKGQTLQTCNNDINCTNNNDSNYIILNSNIITYFVKCVLMFIIAVLWRYCVTWLRSLVEGCFCIIGVIV